MKYVPPVGGAVNDPYIDANPGSGIEGSPVPAAAIEHPMREIMAVISAAGIAPSEANLAQLLAALRSAGVFQTQATNDATTKAATTAFCNPGASLAANGYQKLPSGLIIQWASASIATLGSISFPIVFPTGCFKVFTSWIDSSGYAYISGYTASAVVIGHNFGAARTMYVLAIGY